MNLKKLKQIKDSSNKISKYGDSVFDLDGSRDSTETIELLSGQDLSQYVEEINEENPNINEENPGIDLSVIYEKSLSLPNDMGIIGRAYYAKDGDQYRLVHTSYSDDEGMFWIESLDEFLDNSEIPGSKVKDELDDENLGFVSNKTINELESIFGKGIDIRPTFNWGIKTLIVTQREAEELEHIPEENKIRSKFVSEYGDDPEGWPEITWVGAFVTREEDYLKENNDLESDYYMGPGDRMIATHLRREKGWVINYGVGATDV